MVESPGRAHADGVEAFIRRIAAAFALGEPTDWQALPDVSTNLRWDVWTPSGRYVVKQLRYPPTDDIWRRAVERAAEFELRAHRAGFVAMAPPRHSVEGHLIELTTGVDGPAALIRVHEWMAGEPVSPLAPLATVAAAGQQLASVQNFGAVDHAGQAGSLRWWSWEPDRWLTALADAAMIDPRVAADGRRALAEAASLIDLSERCAKTWRMCHFDHKPDNVLLTTRGLVLLDWDEAAMCPPRCEAAEAALLWAATGEEIDRQRLDAFLEGFRTAGGNLDEPTVADMGKWVASKTGWFDYTARRALQVLPCSGREADRALTLARSALQELSDGLGAADQWVRWMG